MLATTEPEKNVTALLPELRILVLGRSGSGKSTLIRLIVGDGGPKSMCDGTAGKQDIAKEWVLRDGSVPLVFHDSNGTDVKGRERLDDIEKFLEKMQKTGNPIHVVWYIVSGVDRRLRDDGGILGLLGRKKIPFLLVITHNDYEEMVQDNVSDDMLEKLLEGMEDKESVKQKAVKVGNRVKILEGEQLENVKVDVKALKLLSQRTMELISGDLRTTWMAAQLVDKDGKLDESVKVIARRVLGGCVGCHTLGLIRQIVSCVCKHVGNFMQNLAGAAKFRGCCVSKYTGSNAVCFPKPVSEICGRCRLTCHFQCIRVCGCSCIPCNLCMAG